MVMRLSLILTDSQDRFTFLCPSVKTHYTQKGIVVSNKLNRFETVPLLSGLTRFEMQNGLY